MIHRFKLNYSSAALMIASALISSHATAFGGWDGGVSDPNDYSATGSQTVTSQSAGSSCTLYRPVNLTGEQPVILWGNGTGASPRSYSALLRHWASWNFVVVAANTSNAGTGEEMRDCLNWLENSGYASLADLSKVGASGHSQGGGGSIMAGADSRVTTTAPIEGYTLGLGHDRSSWTQQGGPMLLLSGGADTVVSPRTNHAPLFERANVPVFWGILQGASHFEPSYDGGEFREITTAWFLYQLQDNENARTYFEGVDCVYCQASDWTVQRKQIQ